MVLEYRWVSPDSFISGFEVYDPLVKEKDFCFVAWLGVRGFGRIPKPDGIEEGITF